MVGELDRPRGLDLIDRMDDHRSSGPSQAEDYSNRTLSRPLFDASRAGREQIYVEELRLSSCAAP